MPDAQLRGRDARAAPRRSTSRARSTAATCRGARPAAGGREAAASTVRAPASLKSARGHMVFSKPCAAVRRHRACRRDIRCPACGGQAARDAHRDVDDRRAARPGRWRADSVPGKGHAGHDGGEPGDLLHHRARRAASAVPARGRRPAHRRAASPSTRRRSARRWMCRRSTARRGCASRPARSRASAFGCASAACRRRGWPARRSRRGSEAGAAADARRTIEGAAAGVRPDQRRR